MKLTKEEEQELLFKKWQQLKHTNITDFCGIFGGLVQNDITISVSQLKEVVREHKKAKEKAVAEFEKIMIEADELANDTIKFAYKHMVN